LWSERGEPQARDSLKHALTRLRQCLPSATPPAIAADRQSVRLDPASLAVDVCRFEQLLGEGTADALERATALYRGDLLDGVGIHDPSFEDWFAGERQRLRHLAEEALGKLMALSMAAGPRDRAATAARRLLPLDPLREAACRRLMQIDADQARTAQASKLYETLRDRLHRERGSTMTFVRRGIGDVLIAWENEAYLAINELGADTVEVIDPSVSILAEPPVALVDKVVDKHGTREVAQAYLDYLYSPEGQEIAARNYYRPRLAAVAQRYAAKLPHIPLFTVDEVFGGWQKAQATHFADGGIFDQIYKPGS
jgi:hypothetical protein